MCFKPTELFPRTLQPTTSYVVQPLNESHPHEGKRHRLADVGSSQLLTEAAWRADFHMQAQNPVFTNGVTFCSGTHVAVPCWLGVLFTMQSRFFFIRRQPRARLIAHRSIIRLDLPSYSPLEDVCSVWTFESHIEPRNPWCTSTVPDRSGMWALRKWKFFTEVYNSIELWSMHYKLYFRVNYYMFFLWSVFYSY